MKAGAILKTKTGPDKNAVEFFFIYSDKGTTRVGQVTETTVIGTLDRIETKLLTDWAYVKLDKPVTSGGKVYNYVYIRADRVYEFTEGLKTYYVTASSLNVRSTPSSASRSNILGTVAKGVVAGTSDGQQQNGFLYVRLAKPLGGKSFGWLSMAYLSSNAPGSTSSTSTTSTTGVGISDDEPTPTQKGEIIVENAVGTPFLDIAKWGAIGVLAFIAGYMIVKLIRAYRAKRNK